jgi:hypothetical protein
MSADVKRVFGSSDPLPDPLDPEEVKAIEDATKLLKPLVAIVAMLARERKKRDWMIRSSYIESLADSFGDDYYWFLVQGLSRTPDQWLTEEQIVRNLSEPGGLKLHVPTDLKFAMVRCCTLVLEDLETTGCLLSRISRPNSKSKTCRCCVQ